MFSAARIDDALYEDLEAALLMADAGPSATKHLLDDLKQRVRDHNAREPAAVRALLEDALADSARAAGAAVGDRAHGLHRDDGGGCQWRR